MANDTTEAPAEKPVARIITDLPREKVVPLELPVEFDGKTYREIRIKRITGVEMMAYINAVRDQPGAAMMPTIDCPREVYEALDADDYAEVTKAASDFLPRALKGEDESP